jgi:hypothetical protein
LLNVPVPSRVAPSKKETLPVAWSAPKLGVTVAVKVTGWPKTAGFGEPVRAVLVAAGLIVMLKLAVSTEPRVVAPSVLVARITMPAKVPPFVGVPESAPFDARLSPSGNAPEPGARA